VTGAERVMSAVDSDDPSRPTRKPFDTKAPDTKVKDSDDLNRATRKSGVPVDFSLRNG
jgi:hypothetical protein